jgi:hypothetical protein
MLLKRTGVGGRGLNASGRGPLDHLDQELLRSLRFTTLSMIFLTLVIRVPALTFNVTVRSVFVNPRFALFSLPFALSFVNSALSGGGFELFRPAKRCAVVGLGEYV